MEIMRIAIGEAFTRSILLDPQSFKSLTILQILVQTRKQGLHPKYPPRPSILQIL